VYAQSGKDSVTNIMRPATTAENKFYTANKKPLKPLVFIKLSVGIIKQQG
jgi:hypothetical protein